MNSVNLKDIYGFATPAFSSPADAISTILPGLFGLATIVVFLYLVYAGFKFVSSGGNKEEVAKARAMITNGIIGFLLLMVVILLVEFIPSFLGAPSLKIIK